MALHELFHPAKTFPHGVQTGVASPNRPAATVEHASGSSASASMNVTVDPYAVSPSRQMFLSRLSSSRAAHSVPKAQPEDWACPLQSGLRFGVLSQVSPEVSPLTDKHHSSSQVRPEAIPSVCANAVPSCAHQNLSTRPAGW